MITGKNALAIRSGFTRDDLRSLAEDGGGWRVSLYMPLHRTGREVRQAPILLKELRGRAASGLEARGCRADLLGELLSPVNQVYEETDFSLLQGEGLAVLSARGYSATFLLPFAPPSMVEIGKRFLLDPLLPLLFEDGRFHLLALSPNSVRLFQADRLRMREVSLDGLATNMREALDFDDPEERKRSIPEFFRQLDRGLRARLAGAELPLLLAGVENLLPLYREASTHPRIMDQAIPGNPESSWDAADLHAKAWKAYREARDQDKDQVLRLYRERLATPRAVAGLRNVLPAAAQGRVSHLFLRKGWRQWGRFEPEVQRVFLEDGPTPENEDLANLACVHALLGGAKVYALDEGELPEKADIAALCRY
jgi:hypothetical protein